MAKRYQLTISHLKEQATRINQAINLLQSIDDQAGMETPASSGSRVSRSTAAPTARSTSASTGGGNRLSDAARKKISVAQKKRWQAQRQATRQDRVMTAGG